MVKIPDFRMGEAAELLGVSPDTVRRWADAGAFPTRRTAGGHRVVTGKALAAFLSKQSPTAEPRAMPSSARNRFGGIVTRVVKDRVAAQVEIASRGHRLVALMTREAVDALGLQPGVPAVATVKATNVVVEPAGAGA